jgi:excisionase family DNA binding protein
MEQTTILTIDEVSKMLRVSKRSVYEYVSTRGRDKMKANPFPCLRIGDRVLFVREDILAWINRQKEVTA